MTPVSSELSLCTFSFLVLLKRLHLPSCVFLSHTHSGHFSIDMFVMNAELLSWKSTSLAHVYHQVETALAYPVCHTSPSLNPEDLHVEPYPPNPSSRSTLSRQIDYNLSSYLMHPEQLVGREYVRISELSHRRVKEVKHADPNRFGYIGRL